MSARMAKYMAILVFAIAAAASVQNRASVLPQRLEAYLTRTVRLSAAERAELTGGSAVTKLLDADDSKEVAVSGAIWIEG